MFEDKNNRNETFKSKAGERRKETQEVEPTVIVAFVIQVDKKMPILVEKYSDIINVPPTPMIARFASAPEGFRLGYG